MKMVDNAIINNDKCGLGQYILQYYLADFQEILYVYSITHFKCPKITDANYIIVSINDLCH